MPGVIVNIGLIKNLVGIFPCNIMENLNKLLANPMGRQWKQCQTLFFWAPESLQMVSAAMKLKDAYSLEGVTNLDSILKSRDVTLPTKVRLVKAMVFPVVMYRCESWIVKKAEH